MYSDHLFQRSIFLTVACGPELLQLLDGIAILLLVSVSTRSVLMLLHRRNVLSKGLYLLVNRSLIETVHILANI